MVIVRIGKEVIISMFVYSDVQVNIGILNMVMFGVCIFRMVMKKLILVSVVFILDSWRFYI